MYKPIKLSLIITTTCNSRCKYCLYEDKVKILTLDTIRKIVDDAIALGIKSVAITGGEPSLHPDLFRIIDHITSKNIPVGLISNGYNLDRTKIKRLMDYGIVYPWTSLDSHESEINNKVRGQGAFEDSVRFIKTIKEIDPSKHIGVVSIITKYNIDSYMETAEFLLNLGVDEIRIDRPVILANSIKNNITNDNEKYTRLAHDLYEKYQGKVIPVTGIYHGCPMFNKENYEINVYPPGKIIQCCFRNDLILGDADNLKETLDDKNMDAMRANLSNLFRSGHEIYTCVECIEEYKRIKAHKN